MPPGRIDVHTHLLPGVDDGCRTIDDSAHCARRLVAAGYTHAFCTPHIWPSLPGNTVHNIAAAVQALQSQYDTRKIPVRILPGGEINLMSTWPALATLPKDQFVTYALAGKHLLFDFWADDFEECESRLGPAIAHLQSLGLTLILGHPERIAALYHDPAAIQWFIDRAVLFQMNTWCLTEPPDSPVYQTARRLLQEGKYFAFGTDTHNPSGLPTRIAGIEIAEKLIGKQAVQKLMIENPAKLIPQEMRNL